MKLCPNPVCPYRIKHGSPAEFLHRATTCSDCAMPLVDEHAYGTAETERAVAEWHAERDAAAGGSAVDEAHRNDVRTGVGLIVLSVALFVVSFVAAAWTGSGVYGVPLGPLLYGVYRLTRSPAKGVGTERRDGPYR